MPLSRRHLLAVLLATFGFAATARAELIAVESFDYKPGPLAGQSGGVGYDGPWFASPLNARDNAVAAPGLDRANLAVAGNRMAQIGSDVRTFRRLDTARKQVAGLVEDGPSGKALGKDGTTIWISFLIACDSYPTVAYGGFHLLDGVGDLKVDKFGDKRAHQRLSLGRQNVDTHWYLGRVTNGAPGGGAWFSAVRADAAVRLLVYRFDFKPGDEEAWLWIDPDPGREPDARQAAIHAEKVTDFRFNTLSAGAGGSARFSLDEFRLGTTAADVLPRRPAPATGTD